MTKYEAETKESYKRIFFGKAINCSLKSYAASIIDIHLGYYYSWHWENDTWVEQAIRDCSKRIEDETKKLEKLKEVKILLHKIEN